MATNPANQTGLRRSLWRPLGRCIPPPTGGRSSHCHVRRSLQAKSYNDSGLRANQMGWNTIRIVWLWTYMSQAIGQLQGRDRYQRRRLTLEAR